MTKRKQNRPPLRSNIEPTEPCDWCETYGGEMIAPSDDLYAFELTLDAEDWHFCPNCGRRLGDE